MVRWSQKTLDELESDKQTSQEERHTAKLERKHRLPEKLSKQQLYDNSIDERLDDFNNDYTNQQQTYNEPSSTEINDFPLPSRKDYHGHHNLDADYYQADDYSVTDTETYSDEGYGHNIEVDEDYFTSADYLGEEPQDLYSSEYANYQNDSDHYSEELFEKDNLTNHSLEFEEEEIDPNARRSKYSAKVNNFLNNGILITGILLIMVILIAFLV